MMGIDGIGGGADFAQELIERITSSTILAELVNTADPELQKRIFFLFVVVLASVLCPLGPVEY
jgi:hypothetical protein